MSYFFLSFRDPKTNTNLGACIIQAYELTHALRLSWHKGINPGGEVAGFELDEAGFQEQDMELNRLYSSQEMLDMGFNKLGGAER